MPATLRLDGTAGGILLMLAGMLLFSLNDTLGKWLVAGFTVGQILLLRSVAALIALSPLIVRSGGFVRTMKVERPWLHVLRVVLVVIEVACFYWSVRYLPLADAVAYYMASPLFVAALSAPLLGERLGRARWIAVVVGFIGVLIILRPSSQAFSLPALVALAGSITFAFIMLLTRRLRTTNGMTLILWQTLATLLAGAATVPFAWVKPSFIDVLLLGSLGFASTLAHMCVNRSLKLAPAAVVVPFQYSLLLWGIVFGWMIFGDNPDPVMLAGAGVVCLSGLYLLRLERQQASAASPS